MMKIGSRSGFTIIEVMLFLGITGVLMAGIMAGVSSNIRGQRYRDSVEQLRNFIQGQYDKVYSLTNNNQSDTTGSEDPCSTSGVTEYKYRGTASCLYVGRVIEVLADATNKSSSLRVSPIIAKPSGGSLSVLPSAIAGGDSASSAGSDGPIDGYSIFVHSKNTQLIETKQMDWDFGLVTAGTDNLQKVSILIIRSPLDGAVGTYVIPSELTDSISSNLSSYIQSGDSNREVKLCIADLNGVVRYNARMAVIVKAGATGPSGVESLGDKAGC